MCVLWRAELLSCVCPRALYCVVVWCGRAARQHPLSIQSIVDGYLQAHLPEGIAAIAREFVGLGGNIRLYKEEFYIPWRVFGTPEPPPLPGRGRRRRWW